MNVYSYALQSLSSEALQFVDFGAARIACQLLGHFHLLGSLCPHNPARQSVVVLQVRGYLNIINN
ncbi:MAG: hypothetical protein DHS20C06_14740 [Hyphobacterium sp.]|nr:MAG: hypothetical protein DHS20C06_14740 [Hyphobacterium sp.]